MVDKAVDAGWKKSPQKLYVSKGLLQLVYKRSMIL